MKSIHKLLQVTYWFLVLTILSCQPKTDPFSNPNWDQYLGSLGSNQYKSFDQINVNNVSQLVPLWKYHAGDRDPNDRSQIQCNPLVIDGVLYGTSPQLKLIALDAATGEEMWKFDPFEDKYDLFGMGVNRGLNYWAEGKWILYTAGSNLYAVNALNGELIPTFGNNGQVDLKKGLGRVMDSVFYVNNTPGVIYNDLLILGGRVSEGADHAPGHIRAYNIRSGEIAWIFHTIPHPGEYGYETWPDSAYLKSGGANVWAGFSLDAEEGIVYAPTGSASFDFYGGDRAGQNLFANSIIALDANTGERIWHFQARHHDIWDRDLPAPPNLITVKKDGIEIKALAQISKSGHLFVLNRLTGEPIYPIKEVEVAKSQLEGEESWPTQPVPTVYPTFSRTALTTADLAIRSDEASVYAKNAWENSDFGEFLPPTLKSKILFPGMDGGGEWGGAAFDPTTSVLYTNSNEMTWQFKMNRYEPLSLGQSVYESTCQSCHGSDFKGNQLFGNVPQLLGIKDRLATTEMKKVISRGKGVMPAFARLSDRELNAVIKFVTGEPEEEGPFINEGAWPYPYYFDGYKKYLAPDGLPIIQPPWGQMTAIDMNEAKVLWQVPLGNVDSLDIPGHQVTGTENYGGAVVTSGGVVFIAATSDEKFRAFDKSNGQLLWEVDLPAAGYATPATYVIDGKQYVVIACGGGKLGTKSGDAYVAFGLPE